MKLAEQEEVVKHSVFRAVSIVMPTAGRRRPRRVWVERGPTVVSGGFLVERGRYGQRQRSGRGSSRARVSAPASTSLPVMAFIWRVDVAVPGACDA